MYVTKKTNIFKKNKYSKYFKNKKIFTDLHSTWIKDKEKIESFLKNKKKVFVFGAHIFSQVILHLLKDKKDISGVLDNDKNKINNFLYGTELKIFKPYYLKKFKKPCVILRAGSYNNEIKKQILHINPKTVII